MSDRRRLRWSEMNAAQRVGYVVGWAMAVTAALGALLAVLAVVLIGLLLEWRFLTWLERQL